LPVLRLRILLTAHPELLSALLQIIHLVIAGFVAVTDEGVRVNGQVLSLSTPLKADKAGRPLPRYRSNALTLGASEVLLMSDVSSASFDGRYSAGQLFPSPKRDSSCPKAVQYGVVVPGS